MAWTVEDEMFFQKHGPDSEEITDTPDSEFQQARETLADRRGEQKPSGVKKGDPEEDQGFDDEFAEQYGEMPEWMQGAGLDDEAVTGKSELGTIADTTRESAQQLLLGAMEGTGSTMMPMLGLPTGMPPGEKARTEAQYGMDALSDVIAGDEDILPSATSFSPQQMMDAAENLGFDTEESEDFFPGMARRTGRIGTQMAQFGGVENPMEAAHMLWSAAKMGAAGQGAEWLGMGEGGQAVAEIAGGMSPQGIAAATKKATEKIPAKTKKLIDRVSRQNFSDQVKHLTESAMENVTHLAKWADQDKARPAFKRAFNELKTAVQDITRNGLNAKSVKKAVNAASKNYDDLMSAGKKIPIKNTKNHEGAIDAVVDRIGKLTKTEGREKLLDVLKDHKGKIKKGMDGEQLADFVRQMSPNEWAKEGEDVRKMVKNLREQSIKTAYKNDKNFGQKLGKTQELYHEAKNLERTGEMLNGARSENGYNWKTLKNDVVNKKNEKMLKDTLGEAQYSRLKTITEAGTEIEGLLTNIMRENPGSFPMKMFDYQLIKGLFLKGMNFPKSMAAGSVLGRMFTAMRSTQATKVLTNPKYQKAWLKGYRALKNGSITGVKKASRTMAKFWKDLADELDIPEGGEEQLEEMPEQEQAI